MTSYTYKIRADDEEEEEIVVVPQQKKKAYHMYEQTFTAQHIHFYLSDEIGEATNYTDMIHKINTAQPQDTIFIHLNTPGGILETGVQLINAMQHSQAKIVTVLEATAHSLGTLIFLAGDEMIVHDHCMVMFHNFRGGILGKGNELTLQLDATVKWFTDLARKIYIPFLTEDEFTRILRGEDLWIHSVDVRKRLDKMVKMERAAAKTNKKKV